ncbi:hypothetical protein MPSEU_000341500 [Mayamaea pseudoterrestris]|nr:hypothetical protein MPSEU_000341500 [Mayamaea pseudoterrestris]
MASFGKRNDAFALPSKKVPPLGDYMEKENRFKLKSHSQKLPILGQHSTCHSSRVTSIHNSTTLPSSIHQSTSSSNLAKKPAPAASSCAAVSNMSVARVLRYGETIESFFLVHADSKDEYRDLCWRIIHDADAAKDAAIWIKVLELVVEQETKKQGVNHAAAAPDLIRLHRRATTRFPLTVETVPMWLSFAKVQALRRNDALMTLRHVAGLGATMASYYLTKAELHMQWGEPREAMQVLQTGIDKKAQPLDELTYRLQEFKNQQQNEDGHDNAGSDKNDLTERLKNNQRFAPDAKHKDGECHVSNAAIISNTPNANEQSSERPRASTHASKSSVKFTTGLSSSNRPPLAGSRLLQRSAANMFMEPQRLDEGLAVVDDTMKKTNACKSDEEAPKRAPNVDVSYIRSWDPEKTRRKSAETALQKALIPAGKLPSKEFSERVSVESPNYLESNADAIPSKPTVDVSNILAWQPRAIRRKSTDESTIGLDSSACHEVSKDTDTLAHEHPSATKTKQAPVPRIDLSYMLEWNPSKRRPSLTTEPVKDLELKEASIPSLVPSTGSIDVDADKTAKASNENHELEDQPTETLRAGTVPQSTSKVSKANSDPADRAGDATQTEFKTAEKLMKRRRSTPSNRHPTTPATDNESPLAKYNNDFLQMARQDNMLTVNGASYMKIGVIGKGGSCKVYRALSKDGHVLAIKKVKLAGMTQNAMEGYANEIALLKRLRGSPSIIQLYDSQIDLAQKAIFLILEPGEADLNHVLYQQTKLAMESSNDPTYPRLDMNFIRLTWQQMLKAVHCIHEERIVHCDLKPANFLFVRGALKLIDFGIAKAIQSDDTTNIYKDVQNGTLNYMSPESFMGYTGDKYKLGRASDIWSLGCILYQMIYGKTPFAEYPTMGHKMQVICNPILQVSFPAGVDTSAIDCIKQCLRFKAEDRPPIVGPKGLLNEHPFLNARR